MAGVSEVWLLVLLVNMATPVGHFGTLDECKAATETAEVKRYGFDPRSNPAWTKKPDNLNWLCVKVPRPTP